jgi:hypothetical protein
MYKQEAQGKVVETGREARQGFLDRPVLVVLGISVALALLGLAATWLAI